MLKACAAEMRRAALATLALLVSGISLQAGQEQVLSREKREAVVRRVAREFREKYVFADVAERMAELVEKKLDRGEYDSIAALEALARALEEDLRSVSRDRHVKVRAGIVPDFDTDAQLLRRENYGFTAVEILPGNIGYLDFFQFYSVKDAGPTAIAALNFLARCDALIVDLRSNGGGYPELRTLIASSFFDRPVALIEFRGRDGTTVDWSQPAGPGPRLPAIPVYILTSRLTFSCAEDFCFCMQNLGRATIVGETTGGGAHDAKLWSFKEENITLQIPFNEAVDPRTKKSWEGVGIKPDTAVPAHHALVVAVREAALKLLAAEKDPTRRFTLEWIAGDCGAQLQPVTLEPQRLEAFAGLYGAYRVRPGRGGLVMQRDGGRPWELVPLGGDDFKMKEESRHGVARNRVHFGRDAAGLVAEMVIIGNEGNRSPAQPRKQEKVVGPLSVDSPIVQHVG